ncbi:MAG: dTDP-4-dehydrorhamnose reductase [Cellulomonas sp.]|uniref:dTDP-4-dehydrorhamnose reductase n=1 Tax=Cellulomonas sp. TaxID=40001 RepID=UPI001A0899BF|nr:dTDP-4-dehydrorhamnose reductase [Cellulomonas sp.]MBF0686342.1 dTDP-4-dehydrorhamnose reductase [Cellulomonas sp.]MBF0687216.1 dTDP-4-dehydrorhamnose reductase [Cellulomonas sp.]
MRWVVMGSAGMLGTDVVSAARSAGHDVVAHDRETVDILDPDAVGRTVDGADVVVNCAAWTAVDLAEERESDAFAVNATGPQVLARRAREAGARIVQISTDYVFPGDATSPYGETDLAAPRSAYGRTKLAGEWAVRAENPDHLVVRTAWLYGAAGRCFPRTIARAMAERGALQVVADQVGQPTWTRDLADLVLRLVAAGAPAGTYHGTSSGSTSWHGFAQEVVASAGMDPEAVAPTSSADYSQAAPRPAYSVLGHDAFARAGVAPIGDWQERWRVAAGEVLGSTA